MLDNLSDALRLDPARKRALLAELQRARPVPLSFAQRRLWMLDQIEPGAATYNVSSAFRLRGRLDVAALERALNEIVCRHDVLRAVVTVKNDEPFARTVDGFRLALIRRELTPTSTLESMLATESARGFDLQAAPSIRALLVRVAAEDHVLLVTIHHIVTDGWSTSVFKRELGALYDAYAGGLPSPLAALPCRYADFARRERERVSGELLERGLRYWKDQLRDAPPFVEFATQRDVTRSAAGGATESLVIGEAARDALAGFASAHRATLFATLLSIWYLVLHRYTGQRDITIGSAIANRTLTAFEELIGLFVNTLPLRAHIAGDASFSAFLAQVRAMTLEAFDYQEIPLERIVGELNPARIAARTPLVNVMFVLQNAPDEPLVLVGLDITPQPVVHTTAKSDLLLQVTESAHGLTLAIEYRTDLFAPVEVRAMLDAFAMLADAVVRGSNCSVAELPVVNAVERQRQLVTGNTTAPPLSGGSIDTIFERHAERAPERVALVCENESLSYRTLNERANRLAHYLRSIGVHRGSAVGIALERGTAAIVGLLAIIKAGGVYVPIDPAYPRERRAFMVDDTEAAVVLTERRFSSRFDGIGGLRVMLDTDSAWRTAPAENLRIVGSGDDPAYVMYTSGSTGKPKGVLIPHRGIERLVIDAGYVAIGPDDAVAQASTIAFDASTFEIWSALLNGARLVIVPKAVFLEPDALAACIAACRISIMFVTTALFREIVRKAPATFRDLRALLVGGEKLDGESVTLLREHAAPAALINGYGPTEATTFAAAFAVDLHAAVPANIPIGGPIGNTELLILDEKLQLLPRGARGQLYIGGPGLALGYAGNAELTRQKFIRHPLCDAPGARLYATGDLARYHSDGNIEYLGRIDSQIKLRGFRIEPAEIETALRACRGVCDAVVVQRVDAAGNDRLVGYITAERPGHIDVEAVLPALRARLPAHLIPDAIVTLRALPLTSNGKLDREALPAPSTRGTPADATVDAVTDELQLQLVRLWETLLGVHPVGIRDNFFALGGHSLLAVRLLGEIERQFRARLPLAVLFEQPTIEQLANTLRCDHANLNRSPLVALNAAGTALPLFYLHGSVMGGGYYCLAFAQHLGADRPLFVMRPHGVDGSAIPPTIEAIAAECIDVLKSVRPEGPYLLGGFCSGGLVAFEIARQLADRGERVDNVVLIDVPQAGRLLRATVDRIEQFGRHLRIASARRSALRRKLARFAYNLGRFTARLGRFTASSKKWEFLRLRSARIRAAFDPSRIRTRTAALRGNAGSAELMQAWQWISESYVPRRYAGRLTVLIAEENRRSTQGWSTVAQQVDIRLIPGNHQTCITDHIGATARAVDDALA